MAAGTGPGGGIVFTGLVRDTAAAITTIRPALMLLSGGALVVPSTEVDSESVFRSLGRVSSGGIDEASPLSDLSSNSIQLLLYFDDMLQQQGNEILTASASEAPLVSEIMPRFYAARSVPDDSARLAV